MIARLRAWWRRLTFRLGVHETGCYLACLMARGPDCDCSCSGRNHGAGLVRIS